MTASGGLRKDAPSWSALFAAKTHRDDVAVHPKTTVAGVPLAELARLLNLFTTGVATSLFQLHMPFRQAIPAKIIRAAYAPEVRVVAGGAA